MGTLDVSLLNICDGIFQVLASTGNTHLGGVDFDNRLISHCINLFKKKNQIEKLNDLSSLSLQKLKKHCENAKKVLSVTWKTTIVVKDFYCNKNLVITITRKEFEKLCKDLFILCLKSVEDVLQSSDIERNDIDEIILVGGGTRMPTIKENLKLYFNGKEPYSSINPDEVVAAGAAIQAYMLTNSNPFSESIVLLDVIPLSLGIEIIGGVMSVLIPRNSVIPLKRKRKFTTDSDYETSVKIKIYEGERSMTKDNFFVGEFELSGLESAPRGIAEIEITFSIDSNGIINVTAEDLKDNNNKNTITITGNNGRLTKDQIDILLKESQEMELKDKIDREKKQLFYEIDDLCSNIKINIKQEECKIKEQDIKLIEEDLLKIDEWVKEKNYLERHKKDFLDLLQKLKKKYGTLILKINNENDSFKAINEKTKNIGATIFEDENEDENIYTQINEDENGLIDINDKEKTELKNLRDSLLELCYSLFDIISSGNLNIDKNYIVELKDYIDDILLWIHVKDKIVRNEYIIKIDEVNKICNEIVEKCYDQNLFKESNTCELLTKRNELEQICYGIISTINSNLFRLNDGDCSLLVNKAQEILDWIIELDVNEKKSELEKTSFNIDIEIYESKINEINNLCNNLYKNIIKIDYENILQTEEIENIIIPQQGTSINKLKEKKIL